MERMTVYEVTEEGTVTSEIEKKMESIAAYISRCGTGSIILMHEKSGEPFLVAFSQMIFYCADQNLLNKMLILMREGKQEMG